MYNIKIENCNNIKDGNVKVEEGKLNIKYGINGTGKTTIAKAIEYSLDGEKLTSLQTYYSDNPAKITITPSIQKIMVFNEDFVNQIVFVQDEVIEKSFEVFLKTSNYDQKKEALDNHLEKLHELFSVNPEIIALRQELADISQRFKRTNTGKLSNTGVLKSLMSKQNLYNIPDELSVYRPFIENRDINIDWIDWVNKGDKFDTIDACPYCSEKLNLPIHNARKEVFGKTYTKTDSKNLKEILGLIQNLKEFFVEKKYIELESYIKNDTDEALIKAEIEKMVTEIDLIIAKFDAINDFGRKNIVIADIANLEDDLIKMEIPVSFFKILGGEKITKIFEMVNSKVNEMKSEVSILKKEMGALKGVLRATVNESQTDINNFLKTAGINYEISIECEDETNSKTVLKQCFSDKKSEVKEIKQHLSWGEKNAFALILFMYYVQMQNADLIILDDPISSFDSNKKYAILHRMFKKFGKKDVSLEGKTVLLLTHDFEPITDFIVVGKLDADKAQASFIWNKDGIVSECEIDPDKDVCLILRECEKIANDDTVNIVSRIAFLRKLCELNGKIKEWGYAYEILSCLVHTKEIKRKVANGVYVDMPEREKEEGLKKIKEFIHSFDYDDLRKVLYTVSGLKNLYDIEDNAYFKIQIFREMCEIESQKIKLSTFDEGWYKYIDETYHIENDYLHYLDITKFNIVPNYILKKVDELMNSL